MAKRKIHVYESNGKQAKVYRNAELDEYEVRFYRKHQPLPTSTDYFTNDKQDAIDTAHHWVDKID